MEGRRYLFGRRCRKQFTKICILFCLSLFVWTVYISEDTIGEDEFVEGEGSDDLLLRLSRQSKENEACEWNLTVSSEGGTLTSPNYPDRYPSNADCRWLLSAPEPNDTILLKIDSLHIEPDKDCKMDFLQVYAGPSSLSPALGPFCGNKKDIVLKVNSSRVLLVFHSDPSYEEQGFSVDYFTQAARDCQTSITGNSGIIKSPNYPENYPDSTDCWTLITVEQGKAIKLDFDTLDLEFDDNCTFDYVQVFDGSTRDAKLLGQLCRQSGKQDVVESSSNTLLIHFHSDTSVNRKGFRALYSTFNPLEHTSAKELGGCLWSKGEKNGTIASPNYPGKYPGSSNCSIWLVYRDESPDVFVNVSFDVIQLEIEVNCSYDFLEIQDKGSVVLGRYCGKLTEPKQMTWKTNKLHVIFHSDDFGEFSGFKLQYKFFNNKTDKTTEHQKAGDVEEEIAINRKEIPFSRVPQNASLESGASYMMPCATSHPTAKIRWLKGEKFLGGSNPLPSLKLLDNNTLWIRNMDYHLAGIYTCAAVSPEGTSYAQAWITLQNNGANDTVCSIVFRKKPKDTSFAEGEFAHLECLAAGRNVQMSWEKDGAPLEKKQHITIMENGFLFLDQVKLDDAGVYACVARDTEMNCSKKETAVLSVSQRANIEQICGRPRVAQPSDDIPHMEHGKIVGGHNTKKGAYPWQVMLWEPSLKSFCGGTLINERWIATAAHCFVNYKGLQWNQIVIKLGKHDREREEAEEFRTGIADPSSVVVHPAYSKTTFDNDLALVRLRDHVQFSDHILPVCLGEKDLLGDPEMEMIFGTVTGWGKLKEYGPSPRYLQEIRLPIIDQKTCLASTNYTVSRNMFCAGYAQEILGDACHGDSGGPFVMSHNNKWYLVGVVSWGEGCGKANKYGFYTKVPNYLPWIKGIVKS